MNILQPIYLFLYWMFELHLVLLKTVNLSYAFCCGLLPPPLIFFLPGSLEVLHAISLL